jgi:hypothetical protein
LPPRITRLKAQAVDLESRGVSGRRVELWSADGSPLGGSTEPTDADGHFELSLDERTLERLRSAETAGVRVRLSDSAGGMLDVDDREASYALDGQFTVHVGVHGEDLEICTVAGHVRAPDGRPLGELRVVAFDRDLGEEASLGEATTDESGAYGIRYPRLRLRQAGKRAADLIVRVTAADGRRLGDAALDQANTEALMDIEAAPPPSEYEAIVGALAPLIGVRTLGELSDEQAEKLALRAGIDPETAVLVLRAARVADETQVSAAALYGLARRDVPLDLAGLTATPAEVVMRALEESAAQGNIPAAVAAQAELVAARLGRLAHVYSPLADLAEAMGLPSGSGLIDRLVERGVRTLDALRRSGGVDPELAASEEDRAAATLLDAYIRLGALPVDLQTSRVLIESGSTSLEDIASVSVERFAARVGDRLDAATLAGIHDAAVAASRLLANTLIDTRVRSDSGADTGVPLADVLPATCDNAPCRRADSPLAYLAHLLDYALHRLTYNGAPVTLTFLEDRLRLPLRDLPAACEQLDLRVRQTRIAVEALRHEVPANTTRFTPQALLGFAYIRLLSGIGTSFAELRASRTWIERDQRELAARLGLPVPSGQRAATVLGALLVDPDDPQSLTEEFLEQWFGLRDTRRPPLDPDGYPRLSERRSEFLREAWYTEDWPAAAPADARPLIDPDIVGPADMVYAILTRPDQRPRTPTQPIHLWEDRSDQIHGWKLECLDVRSALPALVEAIEAFVTGEAFANNRTVPVPMGIGMTLADFASYRQQRLDGDDISAALEPYGIGQDGFDLLIRISDVLHATPAGTVLRSEWDDLDDVLIERQKQRNWTTWRSEERNLSITLTPQFFGLRDRADPATAWNPHPPRGPAAVRERWVRRLRARIERRQEMEDGLRSVVTEMEQPFLVELRNELTRDVAMPGVGLVRKRELLEQRLQMDLEESGQRTTTRIAQAIEAIQGLLFGARNGLLEDTAFALQGAYFDDEWRWIGSYASWSAAMQVFLYPENALRPTLRRRQSPAFEALADALRTAGWQPGAATVIAEVHRYEDYFADISSLERVALCRTTGLLSDASDVPAPTGTTRWSEVGDILAIARAASGQTYWSAWRRRPGWGLSGSPDQTFWSRMALLPQSVVPPAGAAVTVAGVLPFQLHTGRSAVGLYSWVRLEDGSASWGFTAFDGTAWTEPRSDGAPYALVRSHSAQGALPADSAREAAGGAGWRLDPQDTYVTADLDGDGRGEVVAIGPPRADGSRPLGLFREQAGGLALERVDTLPAGFMIPAGPHAPVLLVSLSAWPWSAERVVVVDPAGRRLALLALGANGQLVLTPQDSAAVGATIDPAATYVAADIDGNGTTELIALDYRTVTGPSEQGPSVQMTVTRATVFNAGAGGLSLRFQQDLTNDPAIYGGVVSDAWSLFEPVRQRASTGTLQDGLVIRATHQYYTAAGNPDQTQPWAAVLMLDPLTGRFRPIMPTVTNTVGGGPWEWHGADRFIALDLNAAEQGILVLRNIDTEEMPPEVALLARQPNGQLRVAWKGDRDIPAAAGSTAEAWSRRVGEYVLRMDVDGDGVRELVVVGRSPDRIGVLRWSGTQLEVRWSTGERVAGPGGSGIWALGSVMGFVAADLDGDGCEELVAWRPGERIGVLRGFAPPVPRTFSGQSVPTHFGPRGVRGLDLLPARTAAETEQRRQLVRDAYLAQPLPDDPNLSYLDEAYYFVAVEVALRLREAGDYTGALDWLRSVYDYRLALPDRAIAYKLVLDAGTSTITRPEEWLRDPLDPHATAASRRNSYTRFTILAIVGCLLDFADAEFTRATAESIPRARELYLEALELLALDVLRQEPGACAGMIGSLEIEIGEGELQRVFDKLREDLATISDAEVLRAAVEGLRPILAADETVPERLARAQQVVAEALRSSAPERTYEALLAHDAELRRRTETALLSDSELARAAQRIAAAARGEAVLRSQDADPAFAELGLQTTWRYVPAPSLVFFVPPNPLVDAARAYAELNLYKLRSGRNIAGLELQLEPYAGVAARPNLRSIGQGDSLPTPSVPALPPLPYRYGSLIERAKELVRLAQQLESALLGALQSRDQAAYEILRARQDLDTARAGVRLKTLQVAEADHGVTLAELQRDRADLQRLEYERLIRQDVSATEIASLTALGAAAAFQGTAAASSFVSAAQKGWSIEAIFTTWANASSEIAQAFSSLAAAAGSVSQMLGTLASYERRRQEWQFQRALAMQDVQIGAQQVLLARDKVRISAQDEAIAELQATHAQAMVDFIDTRKFGTFALYDWMAGVLGQIYRFFLQQATTTARLAEAQLAFERQEIPPTTIAADYWEPPTRPTPTQPGVEVDVRGMTGSERLLRDIFELDQYAFRTNQRRLQLSETISVAQLDPFAFQRFRETGVLGFSTPASLFDRSFPGHYLRLVHRVRVSVIALIPPTRGIRATLATTGVSRVVTGSPSFETVVVPRAPESVSLVAAMNASGLFDLDPQPDVLVPFEGMGVDTAWEFRMPKAANPFDYDTLADVLVTIEYTALESDDLRRQLIRTLDPTVTADRAFSLRYNFPDAWYELSNPQLAQAPARPMTVGFVTAREDFPPHLRTVAIRSVLLYFVHADGAFAPVDIDHLHFAGDANGATARTDDSGVVSIRRGNAPAAWGAWIGEEPYGTWELALPDTAAVRSRFAGGEIADVMLVVTYEGELPAWPE